MDLEFVDVMNVQKTNELVQIILVMYNYCIIYDMNHDTTVNPDEVAFYESLSAFWWDRSGPFWPLHRLNELRVAWILEHACARFGRDPEADEPLSGLRALDIGCGGGILSESIARLGARVTGIDVVEKNIGIAMLQLPYAEIGTQFEIDAPQGWLTGLVAKTPRL